MSLQTACNREPAIGFLNKTQKSWMFNVVLEHSTTNDVHDQQPPVAFRHFTHE